MTFLHFYRRSKKSFFGLVLLCFLFTFTSQQSYASHFAGVDLTYECLSNNQYVVTLALYRDCAGAGLVPQQFINVESQSCGIASLSFPLQLDTFYEISDLCTASLLNTTCNGTGPGVFPGHEVHFYRDTITLPQSCTDWIVSWNSCCRNGAITTLTGTGNMYAEAMINSTICNSSPVFHTRPVMYFCAGQCYSYGHEAWDTDNNVLRYALDCPLQGPNNCIANVAGLSPSQPMFTSPANSFGFNSNTGQMNFCTVAGQSTYGVVKIRVYEIDNNDTIGYIERDIPLIVLNTGNCTSPVEISGAGLITGGSYDSLNNEFHVCQDDVLALSFVVSDPEGDTVSLDTLYSNLNEVIGAGNWSCTIQNTTPYQPDSALMTFQIHTNSSHIGSNLIQFVFSDNNCPILGRNSIAYHLTIAGIDASASMTDMCPGIDHSIQLATEVYGTGVGSISWSQVLGPAGVFDNDTIAMPVFSAPSSTLDGDSIVLVVSYTTTINVGIPCTAADTIILHFNTVPLEVSILVLDSSFCVHSVADTIDLSIAVTNPTVNVQNGSYAWSANPPAYLSNLSSTTIYNPTAIINGNANDSVTYTVNYNYGLCSGIADVEFQWRATTLALGANIDTICPGDSVQLTSIMSDTNFVANPNSCANYVVNAIPYTPVVGSGTTVSLTDDVLSVALPIGFNFDFYCNSYSQFKISSNGFITFDLLSSGAGCCTGQLVPNALAPNDLIALAWEDWNPTNAGVIEYFTVGGAPNRKLVVNYTKIPRFGTTDSLTGQIVLYEGTNDVDIYTRIIGPDGNTTQGIENADGSLGLTVPGRNSSVWSAINEGYRFSNEPNYLFGPLNYAWTPSASLTNAAISNPIATPNTTTTYHLTLNDGGCILEDSIQITLLSGIDPPTVSCGIPSNPQNEILFNWGGSVGATGWEYSLDAGVSWVVLPIQDSSLLFTSLGAGTCMDLWVRALDPGANCSYTGASYLQCCVDSTYVPCLGYSALSSHTITNDTVTFNSIVTGGTAPFIYSWNFGDGNVASGATPSHAYLNSGSYPVSLIVSDSNNCIVFAFDTVIVNLPISACLYEKVILDLTFDNYPGEISWNIQDSSGSLVASGSGYTTVLSNNSISDTLCLPTGCYTFTVFDAYGDGMCCLYGAGSYHLMDSVGTTLAQGASFGASESTLFCVGGANHPCLSLGSTYTHTVAGNVATFAATSNGVNAQYTWDFGDNSTAVGANPTHTYLNIPAVGYYVVCVDVQDSSGCNGQFCDTVYLNLPPCNDNLLTLTLQLDNFAAETSWNLTDSSGTIVYSESYNALDNGNLITRNLCVPTGCYDFNIYDAYGDGICCDWGLGYYLLTDTFGNALANGGTFTTSESTNICLGGAVNPCGSFNVSFTATLGANGLVNFTPQVSGGVGALNYFWDFGIDSSVTTGASYSFTSNGTYLVCLTVSDAVGCSFTYCTTIMVTTATQNPLNGPCAGVAGDMAITQDSINPFVLWLQPIINNAPLNSQFVFYWDFGDGSGTQLGAPIHQYTSFGDFRICMFAVDTVNQCQVLFCDTISLDSVGNFSRSLNYKDVKPGFAINPVTPMINYNTSVNQLVSDDQTLLTLFPNPTSGLINLRVRSQLNMESEVSVLDITGKEIYKTQNNFKAGEDHLVLPVDQLPSGVYIVRMKSNSFEQSLKFIKKGL